MKGAQEIITMLQAENRSLLETKSDLRLEIKSIAEDNEALQKSLRDSQSMVTRLNEENVNLRVTIKSLEEKVSFLLPHPLVSVLNFF